MLMCVEGLGEHVCVSVCICCSSFVMSQANGQSVFVLLAALKTSLFNCFDN